MTDELGTGRLKLSVDASDFSANINTAKNHMKGFSAEAQKQYQQLDKAEKRRVDSLVKQVNMIGKTRQEQIRWNAEMHNIPKSIFDELNKKLSETEKLTQKTASAFGAIGGKLTGLIGGFAVFATGKRIFSAFIQETMNAQQAQLQLGAVLESTGRQAGWSHQQLNRLAEYYSSTGGKSIFSQTEVTQAITNMMEFTGIIGEQVPLALQAAIDVASRKGYDLTQTMETIGRALDIPSQGLASLTRLGFRFSDSVKDQIERLEDLGKTGQAQQLLLDNIASSYDGAGQAARNSFGGALQTIKNTLGDLMTGDDDSLQGMTTAVEDLNKTLSSAATKTAFATFVEGLAKIAEGAINALTQVQRFTDWYGRYIGGIFHGPDDSLKIAENDVSRSEDNIGRWQEAYEDSGDSTYLRWVEEERRNLAALQSHVNDIKQTRANMPTELAPAPVTDGKLGPDLKPRDNEDDKKGGGGRRSRSVQQTAAQRLFDQIAQRRAEINAQSLSDSGKLLASEKELARFTQQMADLKERVILTADQKSLLANEEALRLAFERNVADEKALQIRQEHIKLIEKAEQEYTRFTAQIAAVATQANTRRYQSQDQYRDELSVIGLGGKETEKVQAQAAIYDLYRDMYDDLAEAAEKARAAAQAAGTPFDETAYEEARAFLDEQLQLQLQDLRDYYKDAEDLQADWKNGFTAGLADFAEEAADKLKSVSDVTKKALGDMTDALTDFTVDGAADFGEMAKSIIKDIIRIQYQSAISGIFGNGMNGLLGGLFGGGVSKGGSIASALSKVVPNALGGVYSSPSLSQFSGQVVSQPTMFAFAKGAGLMGEAGPEAIMPLTRGSDGRLGVQAAGMGGAGQFQTNITVHVDNTGGAQSTVSTDTSNQQAMAIAQLVDASVKEGMNKALQPGGVLWAMRNGRA